MRLVLCDDDRSAAAALAVTLEARGHQALAIAITADEGVAAVASHQPDACLMDLSFPGGGDGLSVARAIRAHYPGTAVLVVSGLSDLAASSAAVRDEAEGFRSEGQELDRIAEALDLVAASRPSPVTESSPASDPGPGQLPAKDPFSTLTPRETEVLRRIAAGQNTARMVREMKVTTATLRTYVKNVLAKLGAHSRLEAAALVSRQGAPDLDEPDRNQSPIAGLTPKEREVLNYFAAGAGKREVATHLHMAPKTVNTHLQKIRNKLGVHSTLEAVALARSRAAPIPAAASSNPPSPILG
jgi:two-component system, NarL family, nitrate/nitrite response regulator NarL